MADRVLSARDLMTHWTETFRSLSIERYGVDLGTHWPERAQRLAGRRREERRERVEVYLWSRRMRTYRNVYDAAVLNYIVSARDRLSGW